MLYLLGHAKTVTVSKYSMHFHQGNPINLHSPLVQCLGIRYGPIYLTISILFEVFSWISFFFKPWGLPSGSLGATTWSCARGRHLLEEISRWLLAVYFSLMVRFGLLWDVFDGEIWWDFFCIVVFLTFPKFLSQHNLALGSTWHVYMYIYIYELYMFVCLSIQSCTWEIPVRFIARICWG